MFESIITVTCILLFCLSMWWCLRQYYHARRKGYSRALAATVVFGGALAAVIAGVALHDSLWYGTAMMVVLLLFPAPALLVTVVVALLPRRSRRVGAQRLGFRLPPSAVRSKQGCASLVASRIFGIFGLVVDSGYIIGVWPKSQLAHNLSGMSQLYIFLLIGAAALGFARDRLGAPGLAEVLAADTRPAVLYVRASQQESEPFAWVTAQDYSRYTRRPSISASMVTFEQYLGAEFTQQLAPFVALGNPVDSLPPEGAALSYVPDKDWQQHFCALASAAAAIVMDCSRSDTKAIASSQTDLGYLM